MMQRAISTEQLADFAHQAVTSIRRLMSSSSFDSMTPSQQDLTSTSKQIDDMCVKRNAKVDVTVVELWARSFAEELELLCTAATACQKDGSSMSSSSSELMLTPSSPKQQTAPAVKLLGEALLTQATECLRHIVRLFGQQAMDAIQSVQLLDKLLRVLFTCQNFTKKLCDAMHNVLCDVLGELPGAMRSVMPTFYSMMQTKTPEELISAQQLRILYFFILAVRRNDVVLMSNAAEGARIRPLEKELIQLLLSNLRELQLVHEQAVWQARHSRIITCAVLSLVGIFCLIRGSTELKRVVLEERDMQRLWVYVASNCSKMDVIVTYTVALGSHSRPEERAVSFDSTAVWAAEVAEMLVELCTSDSFSIRRQSLYADAPSPPTPPTMRAGLPPGRQRPAVPAHAGHGPSAAATAAAAARRWETLPTNWDLTLTTGATSVWRLASILTNCKLTLASVKPLFASIGSLDTTSNSTSDFIFRSVVSSVLLLCNATPHNIYTLSEAGALGMLIEIFTDPHTTTFPKRPETSPLVEPGQCVVGVDPHHGSGVQKLVGSSRMLVLSLLAVLATHHLKSQDISLLMCAVEAMRQQETTQEDCEVIENLLHTVGATTYPRSTLFFGGDAQVVCPVDRFAGRWYGYTFAAWINPLCVYSEGAALYSYGDPATSSSVVICLVANGRAKSLAVRTSSSKEFAIALIPDTTLNPDGWNHIAVVHNNFSGFVVFVNGRRTANNATHSFPKEPSRPHKLMFGLGTDCSTVAAESVALIASGGAAAAVAPNGGAQQPNRVPSLFGYIAGMEILDGSLSEKDIERIAAAGIEAHSNAVEPAHTLPVIMSLAPSASHTEVELSGTLAKRDSPLMKVIGVLPCEVPDVRGAFLSLGVVSWVADLLKSIDDTCSNRNTIAVLCAEFLSTAFKLAGRDELSKYVDMRVIDEARKVFLSWESGMPSELSNSILSIAVLRGNGKKMRQHASTSSVLNMVMDLMGNSGASSAFYSGTLKDMSELLSDPDNAKQFREQSTRFTSLLLLSQALPQESIGDFVSLVEKLCKEPAELEQLLRFVAFQGPSRHNETVVCELLRMLYDVARPSASVCELIANAFNATGVWWLVYLVQGSRHRSEAVRICSTKLLALVLHCNRKARDVFARGSGFEVLALAVLNGPMPQLHGALHPVETSISPTTKAAAAASPSGAFAAEPSVRLMTYNCFFKFALDFYTPNSDHSSAGDGGMPLQGQRHVDPRSSGTAMFGFHGHLPGVLPMRAARRGQSVDLGYGNECNDVEVRLSVDENYSAQTASKDLLVYPQAIHIVLLLLGQSIRQLVAEATSSNLSSEEPLGDGLASDDHQSVSVTNSRREDDPAEVVVKVLAFFDRIVDLSPNASALVSQPWLEWLWTAVEPLFSSLASNASSPFVKQLRTAAEPFIRSIIRKVCVVDLSKQVKNSPFRRVVREFTDEPLMQQIVLEEIVRHFSDNNRLDTMDPSDATHCIRNLDAVLQGIDEVIFPFPNSLAIEIVFAIRKIAVNNNTWVRLKMKSSTKLFEVRDRLALTLLTSIREFSKEDDDFLRSLIDANIQDVNALLVILKCIVDAVQNRNLEEVETLQGILRLLYSMDDEQRKAMQRLLDADAVELLQQREKAATTTPDESPQPSDFISWCVANEAKWDTMVQRILKGCKSIEGDVRVHVERREKERVSKLKARRAEQDKKNAALPKGSQELDKLRSEIDGRCLQQYNEVVADCEAARKERDAIAPV